MSLNYYGVPYSCGEYNYQVLLPSPIPAGLSLTVTKKANGEQWFSVFTQDPTLAGDYDVQLRVSLKDYPQHTLDSNQFKLTVTCKVFDIFKIIRPPDFNVIQIEIDDEFQLPFEWNHSPLCGLVYTLEPEVNFAWHDDPVDPLGLG